MAKLKLPEKLKSWKVVSAIADRNGYPAYSVSRVEFDGSTAAAVLTCIEFEGETYNSDNVDLVQEEAAFVKTVMKLRGVSNYLDAVVENNPAKSSISLYLLTSDYPTLQQKLRGQTLSDSEIVDFGLQLSEVLDKLESNNILHGNINPENIYIDNTGHYVLGGFTAFEGAQNPVFTAPEIQLSDAPDITTDIYSLGLVMYTMTNDGKLPFENDETDRNAATKKRFSKAAVSAPANGNEKLKSVIVIACQPENRNRWKNAGNLKNALSAIKAELPVQAETVVPVIVPASTAFESNVFEEFAFEEPVQQKPVKEEPAAPEVTTSARTTAPVVPEQPEQAEKPAAEETEIDNRVFDDYQVKSRVVNINDANKQSDGDYGDFFEETPAKEEAPVVPVVPVAPVEDVKPVAPKQPERPVEDMAATQVFRNNTFAPEEEEDEQPSEKTSKSKIGLIIAIAVLAFLLGVVGTVGFLAAKNGWFAGGGNSQTTSTTAAVPETTVAPSTAATQPTTVPDTTAEDSDEMITPYNIIGTFFDYAQITLKNQGFNVEIGEYQYNDFYDYGYVIAMTPDDSAPLKKGSTITLTVSRGSEKSSSSSNSDSSESSSSESSSSDREESSRTEASGTGSTSRTATDNAVFSEFKANTSYLSEEEVAKMSREELNLTFNEIYARRGRIFNDSSLSAYFGSKSWYTPKYNAEEFVKNVVFNDYEEKNLILLRQTQIDKGYV